VALEQGDELSRYSRIMGAAAPPPNPGTRRWPADDPWARRRLVRLADFTGRTIGLDARAGTTTMDLWPQGLGPAVVRDTQSVDEWLALIAGGQAVGMTSEATVAQYPRPGPVYRPVRDVAPVSVWLGWWRDDPPTHLPSLIRLVKDVFAAVDIAV
jgi:DNA-binding transcriptional LysR family regulator